MSGRSTGKSDAGTGPAPTPPSLERILQNDLESLAAAAPALAEFLALHGVGADASFACSLALEEIVTNIIKYAFADSGAHEIHFAARLSPEHVVLRFTDDGREFNPLAAPPPDLELLPEERPIGGLGIHLVRNLAQRIEYQRAGGRNTVTAFFSRQP